MGRLRVGLQDRLERTTERGIRMKKEERKNPLRSSAPLRDDQHPLGRGCWRPRWCRRCRARTSRWRAGFSRACGRRRGGSFRSAGPQNDSLGTRLGRGRRMKARSAKVFPSPPVGARSTGEGGRRRASHCLPHTSATDPKRCHSERSPPPRIRRCATVWWAPEESTRPHGQARRLPHGRPALDPAPRSVRPPPFRAEAGVERDSGPTRGTGFYSGSARCAARALVAEAMGRSGRYHCDRG
jgi:hypothetical protein